MMMSGGAACRVPNLESFLRNALTNRLAAYPIAGGRGLNPFGRFRHVTALSKPQAHA
jgi:hypothetical protein